MGRDRARLGSRDGQEQVGERGERPSQARPGEVTGADGQHQPGRGDREHRSDGHGREPFGQHVPGCEAEVAVEQRQHRRHPGRPEGVVDGAQALRDGEHHEDRHDRPGAVRGGGGYRRGRGHGTDRPSDEAGDALHGDVAAAAVAGGDDVGGDHQPRPVIREGQPPDQERRAEPDGHLRGHPRAGRPPPAAGRRSRGSRSRGSRGTRRLGLRGGRAEGGGGRRQEPETLGQRVQGEYPERRDHRHQRGPPARRAARRGDGRRDEQRDERQGRECAETGRSRAEAAYPDAGADPQNEQDVTDVGVLDHQPADLARGHRDDGQQGEPQGHRRPRPAGRGGARRAVPLDPGECQRQYDRLDDDTEVQVRRALDPERAAEGRQHGRHRDRGRQQTGTQRCRESDHVPPREGKPGHARQHLTGPGAWPCPHPWVDRRLRPPMVMIWPTRRPPQG